MFTFDKNALIESLAIILRILRTRQPEVRSFCNARFVRRLKNLPLHLIISKCVFILGHCTLHNIARLHRRQVFRNEGMLQIIGEILILRRLSDAAVVKDLICKFRHAQGRKK